MNSPPEPQLLAFARAGFEADLCSELRDLGATEAEPLVPGLVLASMPQHPARMPVFARDLVKVEARLCDLPRGDRVNPTAQAIRALPHDTTSIIALAADSDEGRKLAPLAKSIGNHLAAQLDITVAQNYDRGAAYVVFVSSDDLIVASALENLSNPWPGGIARLRMPRAAPSRSTLKLDEALLLMLDPQQRQRWLKPGMRAVDLGAAPGGWTWQLVERGIQVTAIDNGPMKGELLNSGMVEHLRADGFTWRPKQPMDWLVCDMVAKPARVVERIAHWLNQGWCNRALFNLKLPMQRRYAAWIELRQQLTRLSSRPLHLSARHLYHDREEITVLAWSEGEPRPAPKHRAQPAAKNAQPNAQPRAAKRKIARPNTSGRAGKQPAKRSSRKPTQSARGRRKPR